MSIGRKVLVAGGSALLKKRPLVLGAVALVLALALAALLVTKPWAGTKTRDDVAAPAAGDRVLQSVDVTMQGDGSLTRVGDTVVIARASGGQADSYSTTYDPTKVVDQLPVRILTSYQTDKGSGTDLDDLEGYTGRVSINLSVQNLTVRPQEITYDSAGRSRTATAQVGAPLTVVASAALPGIDPATVVTASTDATTAAGEDTGSTNGVLSRSTDGTTQVQWASILAPPQLSPTATFRVVLDAKDLVVPTLDVSVQPGLVTDPSVGALIDSAFNPKNSSELALETRTIKLIGDVNDVLGRASGTISGVRKTLDASSETLGTKTVQSLTEDTKTISTSLKTSSEDIDALGDDLKGSLTTTQSATLQRMSETVSGLQDLIGDTSAPAPSVSTSGTGCATTVKASGGDGVYGNLLRVTAQLEAYAASTEACKTELQDSITSTIGTVNTDGTAADCADSDTSVVCSLQRAQTQFTDAVDQVNDSVDRAQAAATVLDPGTAGGSAAQLQQVSNRLAALVDGLLGDEASSDEGKALQSQVDVTRLATIEQALAAATDTTPADGQPSLATVDATLGRVTTALQQINTTATTNLTEVGGMSTQNAALAAQLCTLGTAGRLTQVEVNALRGYLTATRCEGADETDPATAPTPPPGGRSMAARLDAQETAWRTLRDQTSADGTLLTELAAARTSLGAVVDRLDEARTSLADDRTTLADVLGDINDARKEADDTAEDLTSLSDHVTGVEGRYSAAQSALTAALTDAKTAASTAQAVDLQQEIKDVAAQGVQSNEDLEKAFTSSSQGLAAAADELRDGTARTLKQQQRELATSEKAGEEELSSRTEAGLRTIAGSVGSATRDIDSTRTTLTADLNNVLLDLGNPDQPGKGLLGTLGKSARAADSADYQLGLASDTVSSYSSVRSQEVDGILLRQAQAEAALQRQAELPAFATELPSNVQHRTVYLFHLGGDR